MARGSAVGRWPRITFLLLTGLSLAFALTTGALAAAHASSPFKMRGVMIDMVRLIERDDVYFEMLEEIADWKMNALFLHFTDSNGCTLALKSHPEVVSPHAMSLQTVKKLIERGRERGVQIVPEVESWGHAGWILHAHPELSEDGKDSLCLSKEAVYLVLEDVIREVASVFPSPYIHIGCDEAQFGLDPTCKDKAARIGAGKMIAGHINRVNRIVRKYGKQSIIWADVVLRHPDALAALDRDIICENWDYNSNVGPEGLAKLREAGLTALAAPSLMWYQWRLMPSAANFENVRRFSKLAASEQAMGVVTTVWVPQRYVPDTLGPGIAWAAWQYERPGDPDIKAAMAAYVQKRFRLEPSPALVDAMARLATNAGQKTLPEGFWWGKDELQAHAGAKERMADGDYAASVGGISKELRRHIMEVRANRGQYMSLILAAECAEHLAKRRLTAGEVLDLTRSALTDMDSANAAAAAPKLKDACYAIRRMELDRKLLFQQLQRMWDRDRYEDDPGRSGAGGSSNLMWWFGSRDVYGYCEGLATRLKAQSEHPDRKEVAALVEP